MFTKLLLIVALAIAAQSQSYEAKVIAAVLVGEAGNQGTAGLSAVAEVIRQRCVEMRKTPLQVVLASNRAGCHAFSCLNRTSPARLILKHQKREPKEFQIALNLADRLLRAPHTLPYATKQATHFTRKEEKPWWAKGHRPVVIIKDHAFYRLPKQL